MIVKPHAWHCKCGRGLEWDGQAFTDFLPDVLFLNPLVNESKKMNFILTLTKVDF